MVLRSARFAPSMRGHSREDDRDIERAEKKRSKDWKIGQRNVPIIGNQHVTTMLLSPMPLSGKLKYSSEGLVLGILPIPESNHV